MIKSSLDTSTHPLCLWPLGPVMNRKKLITTCDMQQNLYPLWTQKALSLFTFWREMNQQVWLLMCMTFTDFVTMNPIFSSATAHHKTQLPGLWISQNKIIQRLRLIWIGKIWTH